MNDLRAVPGWAWFIASAAAIVTAASVAGANWFELAREQAGASPVSSGEGGLVEPVLAAIVPVFTWIGAGIAICTMITRRTRARQEAGLLRNDWTTRVLRSALAVAGVYFAAVVVIGALWFIADVILARNYPAFSGGGDELRMPRTIGIIVALVFAPGTTAALPAILLTASAAEEDPD